MSASREDFDWMQAALKLAQQAASAGEVPVGAVVVCKGRIVGEGWNRPVSTADPTAHAEVLALRQAAQTVGNYRLSECDLYVTLEPCTMCVGAIVHARVKRLIYGAREPKAGVVESNAQLLSAVHFNHSVEWKGGVCEEQATHILQEFFRGRREEKRAEKQRKNMRIVNGRDGKLRLFINNEAHLSAFVELNEGWTKPGFRLEEADSKLAQNPRKIVDDGGYIFSLERENKVIGVCALFKLNDKLYELGRMIVAPEEQGKGRGHLLVEAAIGQAEEAGAEALKLLSNTRLQSAIALYKKHGFVTTARGEHPIYKGCDIVMERQIPRDKR